MSISFQHRAFCAKTLLKTAVLIVTMSSITISSHALSAAQIPLNTGNEPVKMELKNKLSALISFSADFSQSISDVNGKELQSSSGTLTLLTPNMLRWETRLPDETLLIADGTTVWSADPFVEQVTVMQQDSITQNNPLMLLVSDEDTQWEQVSVEKQQSRYVVLSKDESANIVSVTLEFSGDTLTRLQSSDRQQQKSLLVFSNIQQNAPVAPEMFTFTIPDNYIVDDQRSQ